MLHFTSEGFVDADISRNLASAGNAQHEVADVNYYAITYASHHA